MNKVRISMQGKSNEIVFSENASLISLIELYLAALSYSPEGIVTIEGKVTIKKVLSSKDLRDSKELKIKIDHNTKHYYNP